MTVPGSPPRNTFQTPVQGEGLPGGDAVEMKNCSQSQSGLIGLDVVRQGSPKMEATQGKTS